MVTNRATTLSSGLNNHLSSDVCACDGLIATFDADGDAGAGGLLTVFDTEESPLSAAQAVRRKPETREGRLWSRNEPAWVCTVNPEGRGCPPLAETSIPAGASPNSSVEAR